MKKLCIYYGYPSSISNGDINQAVNIFEEYDLIVFGNGLEETDHPDHNNTLQIINQINILNNGNKIFGYIDNTISVNQNKKKIDEWKLMNIHGIFCNQFGYDFGTTRNYQNQIFNYIHNQNLIAFVNAWNPDDVLSGNNNLLPTDWYLAESFAIKNNQYDDYIEENNELHWINKGNKLLNYNIQVATIGTFGNDVNQSYDQNKMDYAYYAANLFGFDAYGWGELNYSSIGGLESLPYRERKFIIDYDYFKTGIIKNENIYKRKMNIGIHIDTVNHNVSYKLN